VWWCGCSHITTHRCILIGYLTTVTLGSTNNALPDDGVTAPKHGGAVLILVLMYILKMFLRQFTCALVGEKKNPAWWFISPCILIYLVYRVPPQTKCLYPHVTTTFTNTVQLYSPGLIGTASSPHFLRIGIIGFFFENRLTLALWSSAVTMYSLYLCLNLSATTDLKF